MKKIGILSDTHSFFDSRICEYFSGCDEIWHAGDVGDISIIERLQDLAPVVRVVSGNIDHGEVRRKCRELEMFKVENINILLTHIGGYPGKWSKGMKKLLIDNDINLMVDGHSHILKVIYDNDLNLLHINPGAAGHQGWQKVPTLVRIKIENDRIFDCEIIELSKKSI